MSAADFFQVLYGSSCPGFIPLWTRQSKATVWLPANDISGIAYEAERLGNTQDVYFGVGVQRERLDPSKRGGAESVIGIPGVWADIDIAGAGHASENLPASYEQAVELAFEVGPAPSIIIDSGGGIQAWWVFPEPWIFSGDADREAAKILVRDFQTAIQARAAKRGWKIDSTYDLARVLRPPGTFNHKQAQRRPVSWRDHKKCGAFYSRSDLAIKPQKKTFEEARDQYQADHKLNAPRSGGTCPICLHAGCFGKMAGQDGRWACFSANHGDVGVRGNGCFHGDVLDLHAHAKRRTAAEHLRAEGYLDPSAIVPATPNESLRKLAVEGFWDIQVDVSKPPLVEECIGFAETGIIYGASGAGKSFFASDLAFHIAMGWPWFGRTTTRGGVLYVAAEAAGSMRLRFLAMATHYRHLHGRPVPLRLVPESVNLLRDDSDVDALIEACKQPLDGIPISVLILDTLAATIPGGDENDFQSMSLLTSRMDKIKRETGATVIAIHHSGKDAARGARGHSSLKGNVDFMIEVTRDEDTRSARIEKIRDGEDGKTMGFQLVPVEVGISFNGLSKMVPIVVHLSADQTRKPPEGRNKENLQILISLLLSSPRGVNVTDWREAFVASVAGQMSAKSARDVHHRSVRQLAPWIVEKSGLFLTRESPFSNDPGKTPATPVDPLPERLRQSDKPKTDIRNLPCRSDEPASGRETLSPSDNHESASGAAATTATTERHRTLSQPPEVPSDKATTPFRRVVAVVAAPASESPFQSEDDREAEARIRSLRPPENPDDIP